MWLRGMRVGSWINFGGLWVFYVVKVKLKLVFELVNFFFRVF